MKSLLWREFRLNRVILILGAICLVLPYLITTIGVLWPRDFEVTPEDMTRFFVGAAIGSYGFSQLTIVLLGANAFAGERVDRSTEFMAYLPVSRERRLVTKLILAAIATAVIGGVNLLVLIGLNLSRGRTGLPEDSTLGYTAITGFVMFCVGWFISSIQSSPAFAVCAALVTPILIILGLQITTWASMTWYVGISLALSAVCFTLGTWYYLKRLEP
jgi:ABC-type transport system involved in multi-copper enzyme maturation permease subunit